MTTASGPDRRRILSLWLPRLPTDRRARDRRRSSPFAASPEPSKAGAPPRATVAKVGAARILAAVDARAEASGLEPGLGLAEARALVPELMIDPHDPEADAALLDALATACDRYTPLVALDPPDGLFLDVTGCAHLFGGEAGLRDDLLARLGRAGLAARAAIAGTPGAAWAMARYGETPVLADADISQALAPLPVEALRLAPETARSLASLGLRTIAQLADQPRASLAARFGPLLLRRLDQAMGAEDEPITPRRAMPLLMVERRLAEPVFQWDVVAAYLARLADVLEDRLEARGEGARRLVLALFHADGAVSGTEIATTGPVRDPARIAAVFAPKLDALTAARQIDSGIDLIRLMAFETGPLTARQGDLDGHGAAEADLARLVDVLSARLGAAAVTRLVAGDSHIPEFAGAAMPAHTQSQGGRANSGKVGTGFDSFRSRQLAPLAAARARPPAGAPSRANGGQMQSQSGGATAAALDLAEEAGVYTSAPEPPERPLRLFARPEPIETVAGVPDGPPVRFRWRKLAFVVARAEGPERIAAEWWHGGAIGPTRDYFRVEDTDGRRFWLFREGLYERETSVPRWYLHGLFG
jgi:protein ImuB